MITLNSVQVLKKIGKARNLYTVPAAADNIINFYYGCSLTVLPNGTNKLTINTNQFTQSVVEVLNVMYDGKLRFKKKGTHQFTFNEHYNLIPNTEILLAPDGTITTNALDARTQKESTKVLHGYTRQLRKKLQTKLRLLGPDMFKATEQNRRKHLTRTEVADMFYEVLTADNLSTEQIKKLFHQIADYSWYDREFTQVADWNPQKFTDKVLRTIRSYKQDLLEKIDNDTNTETKAA